MESLSDEARRGPLEGGIIFYFDDKFLVTTPIGGTKRLGEGGVFKGALCRPGPAPLFVSSSNEKQSSSSMGRVGGGVKGSHSTTELDLLLDLLINESTMLIINGKVGGGSKGVSRALIAHSYSMPQILDQLGYQSRVRVIAHEMLKGHPIQRRDSGWLG